MTDQAQAEALAHWLDTGGPPPEGLDPEVIEAVLALRPDLAPASGVSVGEIEALLGAGEVVPFPTQRMAGGGNRTSKASGPRWRLPAGVIGLLAAAAVLLVVVQVRPMPRSLFDTPQVDAASEPAGGLGAEAEVSADDDAAGEAARRAAPTPTPSEDAEAPEATPAVPTAADPSPSAAQPSPAQARSEPPAAQRVPAPPPPPAPRVDAAPTPAFDALQGEPASNSLGSGGLGLSGGGATGGGGSGYGSGAGSTRSSGSAGLGASAPRSRDAEPSVAAPPAPPPSAPTSDAAAPSPGRRAASEVSADGLAAPQPEYASDPAAARSAPAHPKRSRDRATPQRSEGVDAVEEAADLDTEAPLAEAAPRPRSPTPSVDALIDAAADRARRGDPLGAARSLQPHILAPARDGQRVALAAWRHAVSAGDLDLAATLRQRGLSLGGQGSPERAALEALPEQP